MQIKYIRNVQSVAMSKYPKQSGLDLEYDFEDKVVEIQSINPRMNDVTSYLSMQIPIESLRDVIDALSDMYKQYK